MRLSLTVVDPVGGSRADAVIDAEPESSVAELIPEFIDLVGGRPYTAGPYAAGPHSGAVPGGPPAPAATPPVFVGGLPVDPGQQLAQSPIREGAVVSLYDPSGCPPGEYSGFVELRVAGGPAAGGVFRLGIGRVDVGSGSGVPLRVADPALPARALTLRVASDGSCKVSAHNGVAMKIDGTAPAEGTDRVEWPLGSQVAVGDTLLELAPYYAPDAALRESEDGAGLDYNRPPRLVPPTHPTHFRLPKTPAELERRPMPWAMALMPLVGSFAMAYLLNRWVFLVLAALGPIVAFVNYRVQGKRAKEKHAAKMAEYEATSARVNQDAQNALIAERFTRRHAGPDPGVVLNSATGPRTRLWERRRTDDDYLQLRVGTSELDSAVVLTDPDEDEHKREVTWKVSDAPTAIPLKKHGVIGFAGPGDMVRGMGRWAVGQIAALHSPNDVQIYVLTDATGQESWEWVRWLPHCRPKYEQNANVLIGGDAETVGARIAELTSILENRSDAVKRARGGPAVFSEPDIVVIFDGSRRMRTLPGVIRLLKEGPAASIVSICLDDEERYLPGECQAVAVAVTTEEASADPWQHFKPRIPAAGFPGGAPVERQPGGHPGIPGQHPVPGQFGPPGMAPGPPGMAQGPPGMPGQFGPPGGAPPVHQAAVPAWQVKAQAPAGETVTSYRLRVEQRGEDRIHGVLPDLVSPVWGTLVSRALAPLRDISDEAEGAGLPGSSRLLDVLQLEPPTPDGIAARWQYDGQSTTAVIGESYDGAFAIDLRRDGPHGLIAGTTGSGKSELLQTIVAALAVANTPENMTFVLVDYKGGSAFKDCVQLPHTVGMVTDLDNHLVERALRSLGAELTRREHILAGVGAKDIEDYQDLLRREPGRHAVMPRLLIVIDEFASMARELPDFVKGLVNIAQRGRSLGIHLLLATQRPSGVVSPEIRANTNLRIALRVTDGSESTDVISSPEASLIAKTTPGRAYVRLGAASLVPFQSGRVGGRRPGAQGTSVIRPWTKHLDWHALGRDELKRPPSAQKQAEDDNTDLRVLVEAVIAANQRLGISQQHSPWLPSLPERLLLAEIPRPGAQGALPAAPFGLEDIPEQQSRRPLAVDFKTFGHLLVAGAPRTGRSQLLRTMAGSLAMTHSSADVHLYGFDCGNGALNILTRLPHCGAVVGRNQVDRAKRLLARLVNETSRRQELLAQDALADINEQRATAAPEDRLPHIVVLLDRWDGWVASLGTVDTGALTDQLFLVMREGSSVGIHVVITGDPKVMTGRIGGLSEDKYVFRLPDRTDYTQAGLRARELPDEIPPGRLYRSQSAAEIQIGVLGEDLSGQGQAAAVAAIGDAAKERDAQVPRARRPFRVDVLPARLTFDDAWEMRDPEAAQSRLWSLIGVGGDELTAFGPDLGAGIRSFVIAGPAQSGRSTVLCHMARCFLRNGVRMVLCTPRESPLAALANEPGVLQLITGNKLTDAEVVEALSTASPENPIVFMMDDAEDLRRRKEADTELKAAVSRGAQRGVSVIVAGDEAEVCSGFSGWQAELKKAKRGLLLSPATHRSGDLIGAKLPRSAAVERPQPGSGVLHLGDGTPMSVRIPVP